ncbi:DUF456 domain-containing protein [Rhodopirellula sp. P2]|uniref:DUF456 domain-containing protein n=1 Tax=Rhodopirellula sp. P2 TaxID=2127060 RepID=UPI0023674D19|nr:DUF456 domain-containing protein [Rhodopirellula sp. P2]WDQ19167.1 DUF456 domain-containing protein [Rhodopirellula sp. P2]
MIDLQIGWLLAATLLSWGQARGADFVVFAEVGGISPPQTLVATVADSSPAARLSTSTDVSQVRSEMQAAEEASGGFWARLSGALVWARDMIRDVMMPIGVVALGLGLILVCTLAWLLNLVALPGNWLAIALMAFYVWLGPETGRWQLGVASLAIAFVLGLVGELVEFLAGAMGASRAGASRRATLMAIVGSILGAIVGGIVGLPIPVIGPVLAAVLFGGLGATAGAMFAEWNDGKTWRDSWRIGQAAFWGRTTGTVGKMVAGLLILVVCAFGVLF